jgi:hypothetical protein
MKRRSFLQSAGAAGALASAQAQPQAAAENDRAYWVRTMSRIAEPVLANLAAGTLKRNMPIETVGNPEDRRKYSHLEAIGRLLAGIAPWLETPLDPGPERDLQQRYLDLARRGLRNAADPQSPDYLNFHEGAQPLVDCGFLGQAILRAPTELWKKLDGATQKNLAAALLSSRAITPGQNNWLLFSATVEAALAVMGERFDAMRIDYAVRAHQQWYVGDGLYGDGPRFHWDYYNSFVIQPMLLDVLRAMEPFNKTWQPLWANVLTRAKRYAAIQERLISPEGTYPVIGRSIAYRTGAFQLLAQMALMKELPEPLTPPGVRAALTSVMRRVLEPRGTFDANGWLTIGVCGHQPHLGENYISTGSLYLCSGVFLPLGLSVSDPFWSQPGQDWTSRRIFSGEDAAADHAIAV